MRRWRGLFLVAIFVCVGLVACSSDTDDVEAQSTKQVAIVPLDDEPDKQGALDEQTEPNPYYVAEAFAVGRDVYVRSLAVDTSNNSVWIGTSVGVLEVDLGSRDVKNTYTRKEGLANEYVFAIHVDTKGGRWFGTNGGGVSSYDGSGWRTYFPMHGLADYWAYSFGEQSDGTIWIGTWYGVNRFNPVKGDFETYVEELVNEWVYGIAVDRQERVWFGTEGGISMFDGKSWHSWTSKDGLGASNERNLPISTNTGLGTRSRHDLSVTSDGQETYNRNYVFSVMVAQNGDVWVGTWGGGVSRFDGSAWHNLTQKDGLAGDVVFSVAQDKDGVFWFGTNKGLSRYDGENWHTFTHSDGLLSNNVYAIATTDSGGVWVGTKNGVAWLARKK